MMRKILPVFLLLLFLAGSVAAGDLTPRSITYEPAPVGPGGTATVWVFIKNDSAYIAESGVVKVDIDYPLSLQPRQEAVRFIDKLEGYKTASVEYKILVDAKAIDGEYEFKVLSGEDQALKSEVFYISVVSRTPKLEVIESDVTEVSPGTIVPVNLTIKNIGGSIAKNIVVKIKEDRTVTSTGIVIEREIVALGPGAEYLDSLGIGEQQNVLLQLAVNQDAKLKNYSVPITLEYYDLNGTAKSDTVYLGLKVTADPEVDAVIDSVRPFAYPGMAAEMTIDLFNIGLADAKYVVIELEGAGVEFDEPRQFIGTLEADDFDSFKTGVKFAQNVKPGKLPITLKVIYKGDDLQEQTIEKTLNITVLNAGELQATAGVGPGLILVGLIGLALQLVGLFVVAKFGYRRYKQFRGK